jgi:hypothetical protein
VDRGYGSVPPGQAVSKADITILRDRRVIVALSESASVDPEDAMIVDQDDLEAWSRGDMRSLILFGIDLLTVTEPSYYDDCEPFTARTPQTVLSDADLRVKGDAVMTALQERDGG